MLYQHFETTLRGYNKANSSVDDKFTLYIDGILTSSILLLSRAEEVFAVDQKDSIHTLSKFSINMSILCVDISRFAKTLSWNNEKLKVKICSLISLLLQKRNVIGINNEILWRNYMLEMVIEWNSVFSLREEEVLDLGNSKIMELDEATLKVMNDLLTELSITPTMEQNREILFQTNNDDFLARSKLFQKYFKFFLKILQCIKMQSVFVD